MPNLRIGSIWSVPIYLHWSMLFLVSLAVVGGPASVPAILIMLGSLLAHELGHVRMAQKLNYPVNRILFMVFGGLAYILLPKNINPRHSFKIAIAGPAASATLSILGLMLMPILDVSYTNLLRPETYWPAKLAWEQLLVFFTVLNIITAIANMIPIHPLDGGRVYLSLIRMRGATMLSAEKWVGITGMICGTCIMIFAITIAYYLIAIIAGAGVWTSYKLYRKHNENH